MFENASEIKRFSRHLAAANTDIYTSEDKFYLNEGDRCRITAAYGVLGHLGLW